MIGSQHGPRMASERSKDMLAEARRQRLANAAVAESGPRAPWWARWLAALRPSPPPEASGRREPREFVRQER